VVYAIITQFLSLNTDLDYFKKPCRKPWLQEVTYGKSQKETQSTRKKFLGILLDRDHSFTRHWDGIRRDIRA
jgi:hypothetical protein